MRLRINRPSPAMVVACTALAISLGGTGYAAIKLPANSVGSRQLKKSAVTNRKLARGAVTGSKVARNSLTGAQINASTLGTVPNATTAQNVAASEAFHLVGATGEPGFQHSWQDGLNPADEPLSFYKDREGIVHLRGSIYGGPPNNVIFQLPSGYRPASGKFAFLTAACECSTGQTTILAIAGSGFAANVDGGVSVLNGSFPQTTSRLYLDGISFRAGS